jgi:hypothetical protein
MCRTNLNGEAMKLTTLEYRLTVTAEGTPLAILDSRLGSGHDLSPSDLRAIAAALVEVADEAEHVKLGRGELWKSGVKELR